MLEKFDLTRTRVAFAAGAAAIAVGGFAVAWADAAPSQTAGSGIPIDDVSGPCDEAEHAGTPECDGRAVPDDDSSTSTTTTVATSTTSTTPTTQGSGPAPVPPPAGPASGLRTVDASGAGTVTYAIEGASLRLVSAVPNAGWDVEVEQSSGVRIDLDFRSGTRRVQVDIEFEDGRVRERARFRDDADDVRVETIDGIVTDDRSGSGGDDDRSGHDDDDDHGDDDDHEDDDRSGSGDGSNG